MKDPRRKFTISQARYLFERSGGLCEVCGEPLPDGWPAHHVEAHAAGGRTAAWNGQALCQDCHHRTHMTTEFTPRAWQLECFDNFCRVVLEERGDLFAFEACMGAGKSMMAAMIARALLRDDDFETELGPIDHVLVLVPSTSIRGVPKSAAGPTGMCKDFLGLLLNVRTHFLAPGVRARQPVPTAFDVSIITYQAAVNAEVLETIRLWKAEGWRFALVVDEIHHTMTTGGAWGPGVLGLRKEAAVTVRMTGTDFRSDGRPTELTTYEDGQPVAHYRYLYTRGMIDKVVRPCTFRYFDATYDVIKVDTGHVEKTARLSDARSRGDMVAAQQAFATDGGLIGQMIAEAHADLMRTRVRFPDAACLFLARPGRSDDDEDRYVQQLAARVRDATGCEPTVFTCHDSEDVSDDKMARCVAGTSPYIVAVNKLSEGANIPRIRSIVFCRTTDSELMFRQFVGRGLRWMPYDDGTAAAVYLPAFPRLKEFAANMEGECLAARNVLVCPECGRYPCECPCPRCHQRPCVCDGPPPPPPRPPGVLATNVRIEGGGGGPGGALGGADVLENFIRHAQRLVQDMPAFAHGNTVQMALLIQIGAAGVPPAAAPKPPADLRPAAERERSLSIINKKIKSLAQTKYKADGDNYGTAWRKEFEEVHGVKFREAKEQWGAERLEREAERLTILAAAAARAAAGR